MNRKLLFFITKHSLKLYSLQNKSYKLIASNKFDVNRIISYCRKNSYSFLSIPITKNNTNIIGLYLNKIESF